MRDHNWLSGAVCRSMPYLHCILALNDFAEAHHMFFSTDRLLEPVPWPSMQEDSVQEGPFGLQHQVLAHSLPLASPGRSGILGHHLPWQQPTSEDGRLGMAPALTSSSSSPEGTTSQSTS